MQPFLADDFSLRGGIIVQPGVIVAFEDEAVTLFIHDAVNDQSHVRMWVRGDVVDEIGFSLAQEDEVTLMIGRLHAGTANDDVGNLSTNLARSKGDPK